MALGPHLVAGSADDASFGAPFDRQFAGALASWPAAGERRLAIVPRPDLRLAPPPDSRWMEQATEHNPRETAIAVAGPQHLELSSGALCLPPECCSYRQEVPEPVADLEDCVGGLGADNSFRALSSPDSAAIPERDRRRQSIGRSPVPPPTAVSGPSQTLLCCGAGMADRDATLPQTVGGPAATGVPAVEKSGPEQQDNLASQLSRAEPSPSDRSGHVWPESMPEAGDRPGKAGGQDGTEAAVRPTVPATLDVAPDFRPSPRPLPPHHPPAPRLGGTTTRGPEPPAEAPWQALPRPLPQASAATEGDFASRLAFAVRIRDNSDGAAPARQAKPLRAGHDVSGHLLAIEEEAPPSQPALRAPRAPAAGEAALTLEARANGESAWTRPSSRASAGVEPAGENRAPHNFAAPLETSRAMLSQEPAPRHPAEPTLKPAPEPELPAEREVRQITLRLEGASGQRVQVAVQDRTGEIRVAVSAQDTGLAGRLREGAAQLISRLEARGFAAELLPGAALFSGAHRWPEPGEPPVTSSDTPSTGGSWENREQGNHRDRRGSPSGWEPEGRQ